MADQDRAPLIVSVPVPGGFLRVSISSEFEPREAVPAPSPAPAQPTSAGATDESCTENQARKIYAEMHRIGEDLAKTYMSGHFGTTNPKELHKRAASQLIKWLLMQPSRSK